MKVKDLIKRLKTFAPSKSIQFYKLENNDLQGCDLETILDVDGQVEITIEPYQNKKG